MKTEKAKYTPGTRCTKCHWIHEADSIAGTSFQGVGLCPEHAAAPELLAACKAFFDPKVTDAHARIMADNAITKAEAKGA